MRKIFVISAIGVIAGVGALSLIAPAALWSLVVIGPLIALGAWNMLQTRHAVLRNFPLLGNFRYFFETIRPEISQYFIESDTNGVPFSREQRSVVYQRAKQVRDTVPFGTLKNVYDVGYEWVNHSIRPIHVSPEELRVDVGGPECDRPYSCSLLNVSAMSFGSLSSNAILALSRGARLGAFAHNTGEGSISRYHLEGGRRSHLTAGHRLLRRLPFRRRVRRRSVSGARSLAERQDDRAEAVPGGQAGPRRHPAGRQAHPGDRRDPRRPARARRDLAPPVTRRSRRRSR